MTDINQAGLEAAQLAIAKCTAVGRTTLEDHAYEAVTAYLEATKGGEAAATRIEQLEADVERHINTAAELRFSLDSLLEYYVNMINSGDCGNWNPEGGE